MIEINGIIIQGSSKGRYFMALDEYKKQCVKKLGILPYYGTLNIKLIEEDVYKIKLLKRKKGISISGFKKNDTYFGSCKCFLSKIEDIDCAVILPEKSKYNDVIEIISKYYLRKILNLNDGDKIKLKIYT